MRSIRAVISDRECCTPEAAAAAAAPDGIFSTTAAPLQFMQADPVPDLVASMLGRDREEYSGVISLIDDLANESQELGVVEEHAEKGYEEFTAEPTTSRPTRSKGGGAADHRGLPQSKGGTCIRGEQRL